MKFKSMLAVGVLAAATLIPLGVTSASATYDGGVCIPAEAWTETIEHPAEGEPTITVENPDYKPAVDEVSHIVHHEAVTDEVHHEAVTHTEYGYIKWNWNGPDYPNEGKWHAIPGKTDWTTEQRSTEPWVEGQGHSSSWFKWHLQGTRTVVDKEAWTETVVVKEAWDEKVIDVPGQPAVGELTITIDNPDYVEAWTEVIEHEEVKCPSTEEPFTAEICHGYGTAEAVIITVDSKDEWLEHLDHGDAPMTAELCEDSKPVVEPPFSEELCHGYGTADAAIVVLNDRDEWLEHLAHGDAPMSAETCADSIPVIEEPTFPICHVTVVGDTEGENIRVERDEILEHLDHGDYPGTCVDTPAPVDPEEPTPVDPEEPKPEEPKVIEPAPLKPAPVAAAAKVAATDDSTLAVTGAEFSPWTLGAGLAALIAGAGLVALRRKH